MAFTFGFYNAQNHDRRYNAEQFGALFDGIINDGVFDSIGETFQTKPGTGLQVIVGTGKAWFNRTWSLLDAPYPLAIPTADATRPRTDAVVLVVDKSDAVRENRIEVRQGGPQIPPKKPELNNNPNAMHWEYPLAWVTVQAGATSISAEDVEIQVGRAPTPFVTGIIETADISELFQQWSGQFNSWFDALKAQLSGNVVTNLQNQINNRVQYSDNATLADMQAGVSDRKYVTPKGLRDSGFDGIYSVGDIVETCRRGLGDKWRLCNGDAFDPVEYPELAKVSPPIETAFVVGGAIVHIPSGVNFPLLQYYGDSEIQVALYDSSPSSGDNTVTVAWSTDGFGTRKTQKIELYQGSVQPLFKLNGDVYIPAVESDHPSLWRLARGANAFTSVLGPDNGGNSLAISEVTDMWYANGKYCLACRGEWSTGNGKVLCSTSPDFKEAARTTYDFTVPYGGFVHDNAEAVCTSPQNAVISSGVLKFPIAYAPINDLAAAKNVPTGISVGSGTLMSSAFVKAKDRNIILFTMADPHRLAYAATPTLASPKWTVTDISGAEQSFKLPSNALYFAEKESMYILYADDSGYCMRVVRTGADGNARLSPVLRYDCTHDRVFTPQFRDGRVFFASENSTGHAMALYSLPLEDRTANTYRYIKVTD